MIQIGVSLALLLLSKAQSCLVYHLVGFYETQRYLLLDGSLSINRVERMDKEARDCRL